MPDEHEPEGEPDATDETTQLQEFEPLPQDSMLPGYKPPGHGSPRSDYPGRSYPLGRPVPEQPFQPGPQSAQPGYPPQGYPQGYPPQAYHQGYPYQPPPPPRAAGQQKALIALAAVVALILGGTAAYALNRDHGPSASPVAAPSTPAPSQPTAAPAPSASSRLSGPVQALALSAAGAEWELDRQTSENAAAAADLRGAWVPQVSSKCVGVKADIGPDWTPDGRAETSAITVQQILAFNLALADRFGAVTVRQADLGITEGSAAGACTGKKVWMSIVPDSYSSPIDANAWCAQHVPLKGECFARYVARPGEKSASVLPT